MPTLYDISDDLLALESILIEAGGDVTDPEADQAVDNWLAELGSARDEKIDAYCSLYREFDLRAKAREEEATRLFNLASADLNAARRLRERLLYFFELHRISKLETERFRLTVAANGGALPLFVDCEPEALPEDYQRVRIEADKAAIREALESGAPLDFARLGERGRHLRIR
jgi:hypothetical protein